MSEVNILKQCLGLNNKVDPSDLIADPESGLCELAVAADVDIESSGRRISRRKGYTKVYAGKCHSLFPFGNICFVVIEGYLSILYPDFSYKTLIEIEDRRISYVEVGNRVYFMNGSDKGYIEDEVVYPWEFIDYSGPSTTKVFEGPPLGHLLELYNGFMFIAQDNILWHSRPFKYHAFYLHGDYVPFNSRITMMRAVKDGLYVSTESDTYYFNGYQPKEFFQVKVADYPAILGTDVLVDGRKIEGGDIKDRIVVWTSSKGICIGGPEGLFKNLTERRLMYPSANCGAGICIDNRYVCTLGG
jgi:hypothetical protein